MKNESRKHHYVPKSVLKNFTLNGAGKRLFVFDKQERRSFISSIYDAGAERDFNRIKIENMDINYEEWFQELDNRLAEIVKKLIQEESIANLNESELIDIHFLIACQLIRTKNPRTMVSDIHRGLLEWIRSLGFTLPESIDVSDGRHITPYLFFQLHKIAYTISRKDIVLLISREQRIWTSDNPVVIQNTFPYGQLGLESPGIELYYPIAPHLCLAFFCPSIREIISESIDPNHPRQRSNDPFVLELHNALVGQRILEVKKAYSIYLNELQVGNSSRFLYSSEDDFGLAGRIISQYPKVADVTSRISFGTTGPPVSNMPPGTWLVAYKGYRHHALQIELVNSEFPFIDFKTTDVGKLEYMYQDMPLDEVTVYQEGKGIRGMREVVLILTEQGGGHFIRAQHSDPALNEILSQRKS